MLISCIAAANWSVSGHAADLQSAEKLFLDGEYEKCARIAAEGAAERGRNEDWPILLSQCYLIQGRNPEAVTVISNAMERNPWGIRVRVAAHEVFRSSGLKTEAENLVQEIGAMATARAWAYRDAQGVVALGRAALLLGADPRRVLDNFLNRVKKAEPDYRETYLVIGRLALDKFDNELAANTFREGLLKFPKDPEMLYGLAKALAPGDRSEMIPLLEKALEQNERHLPSLLLLADHLIDAEEDKKAEELLARVLAVNPHHPEAWAYQAVLAHLRNQPAEERTARASALHLWKANPRVDHLIGLKLSQKYRFAEGSACQRRALAADPEYLSAKSQLAQDLLRLGEDEEGWRLAEEVYDKDGYDVVAYNLVTLRDTISGFSNLTHSDFRVRMHPREAAIYGERVTELLEKAKETLCAKYGIELPRKTVVEIFPEQKDFAVRTFGMPGGEGFLGVCFGNVITANSPASHTARQVNWQAVLWHEFCHVVTLGLTKNKMPRWLSEGISVYEERLANPAWGERLIPRYREMILKGELVPVGSLSSAFLAPKTPLHLQFAYYQSSLVVEYLVGSFGMDALKRILADLGEGKEINDAIESNAAPLSKIEKEFAAFAKDRAEQLGQGLDWNEPTPEELAKGEDAWIARHPKSLWGLTRQAKSLLATQKYEEAKAPLRKLIELYPENVGTDNAYALLAEAHRGLSETEQERAVLSKLARIEADAVPAYLRLMDLDLAARDWKAAVRNAERFLSVNPLVPQPYRCLAEAHERLGQDADSIKAWQTLLLMDPPDPASVHYRLAALLHKAAEPGAKRHVLQALEEAPRFRDAHRLLLRIAEQQPVSGQSTPVPGLGTPREIVAGALTDEAAQPAREAIQPQPVSLEADAD